MSCSNCCFLTCIQVLRRQITWSGIPISLKIFQFVVIHIVKVFHIANEKVDFFFLEFSCFLYDPLNVSNLTSSTSAFSTSGLYIWNFSMQVLLEHSLEDFEYNLAKMRNVRKCTTVWTFFGIALLWDLNENWPFPVLWPLLSFPNLLTYWVQKLTASFFLRS